MAKGKEWGRGLGRRWDRGEGAMGGGGDLGQGGQGLGSRGARAWVRGGILISPRNILRGIL